MDHSTPPISLHTVGIVHSCFKEKFGIPRQPGLAQDATAVIELINEFANPDTVRGLEHCSHLWVLFLFSEHLDRGWTPLVRPPRSKGGKMGVFATRSTFRPNPIGMSTVELDRVEITDGKARIHIRGADILDGTPVIDIKPYLPYSDSLPKASNQYAPDGGQLKLPVVFSEQAKIQLQDHEQGERLQRLIRQVLVCDPRPTQHQKKSNDRSYGILLDDVNVRWRITEGAIEVSSIEAQI